jgi:anti-sigma factor RsiW
VIGMSATEPTDLCGHYAQMFSAWLDRSLPAHIEREITEHLETCPGCRGRLEGMRQLVADLHRLGEVEAGPELAWAIKRAVHREARHQELRGLIRPLPLLVSAAAAAVVLVMLGGDRLGSAGPVQEEVPLTEAATATSIQRFVLPPAVEDRFPGGLQAADPDAAAALQDSLRRRLPALIKGIPVRFF